MAISYFLFVGGKNSWNGWLKHVYMRGKDLSLKMGTTTRTLRAFPQLSVAIAPHQGTSFNII